MMHLYNERRTVLLIDRDLKKQKLRANVLRGLEIEVHAAESTERAESLWRSHLYDLILVAAEEKADESYLLSARIRLARPEQRIALLVGPPTYIRELPGAAKPARRQSDAGMERQIPVLRLKPDVNRGMPAHWQETIQKVVTDWYSAKMAV